jgi:hypothetical protein
MHGHKYVVITPNDIVIPPQENDTVWKNQIQKPSQHW